jgi:DNA-binding NarL/FixJ family response regulator
MPIRVLIADDHSVVRQGLRTFLEGDRGLELVGEAKDGAEALRMAHRLRPDVIPMDLLMPGMDGLTATAAVRRELPDTEVLALTSVLEDSAVVGAVRAGAIGYMLKSAEPEELRTASSSGADGRGSCRQCRRSLEHALHRTSAEATGADRPGGPPRGRRANLAARLSAHQHAGPLLVRPARTAHSRRTSIAARSVRGD